MDKREEFRKRLMATFRVEAQDYVASISSKLVALEKADQAERQPLIEAVFRAAHSLKGAARTVNLVQLESACHGFEDIFAEWKRHLELPAPDFFDRLLQASDRLGQLLKASVDGSPADLLNGLQAYIEHLLKGRPVASGDSLRERPENQPPRRQSGEDAARVALSGVPRTNTDPNAPVENSSPVPVPCPGIEPILPVPLKPSPPPHAENDVGPVPVRALPPASIELPKTKPDAPNAGTSPDSVRVNTEKLDNLLLKVEELLSIKQSAELMAAQIKDATRRVADWKKTCGKSRLIRKSKRPQTDSADDDSVVDGLDDFLSNLDSFSAKLESDMAALTHASIQNQRMTCTQIDSLMDDLKKLLMQPFSTLLEDMPRIVRNLAKDLGKEADFVSHCGLIEMDRRILEEMRDPLVHMLRNCLDHGIETASQRIQAGKKPCGQVTITVRHRDGQKVEIIVEDDGAGLDTLKLKEAAVKNGLVNASEANSMSDEEAHRLIFQSGLSTCPIVTDLSGRGLGMAIVRERIEKVGGRVDVESRSGKGALFRILLPTVRATFRGVLVRARDQHYVFPTLFIDHVVRIDANEIRMVENREAVSLDGRLVALARLADALGVNAGNEHGKPPRFRSAVVATCGGKTLAFLVDAVLNEHEILLKNFGGNLRRVRNFEGATMLQDGKLVPVLNVSDLFQSAIDAAAPQISDRTQAGSAHSAESKRILVVEDSITSRTLLKNIIEAAHYEVETAVDGIDGFTKLRDGRFDLVVSDVEMPRLHGFDLTLRIRNDRQLAETPVILVTARESREDRERGIEVGANAYIVKSSFDQANLIEVIRRFL